jgi:H+/Cl- antiporter ClcA
LFEQVTEAMREFRFLVFLLLVVALGTVWALIGWFFYNTLLEHMGWDKWNIEPKLALFFGLSLLALLIFGVIAFVILKLLPAPRRRTPDVM